MLVTDGAAALCMLMHQCMSGCELVIDDMQLKKALSGLKTRKAQ